MSEDLTVDEANQKATELFGPGTSRREALESARRALKK